MKEEKDIELRSEKVRSIIGEIPPKLVRWGTVIIAIITISIFIAAALIHYPHSTQTILEKIFHL